MFALYFVACVFVPSEHGSGVSASEERPVGSFDVIENQSTVEVSVEVGPDSDPRVTVTCDDNLLEEIRTRAVGSSLVVDHPFGTSISPTVPCSVLVRTPGIQAIDDSGTGGTRAEGDLAGLSAVSSSGTGPVTLAGHLPDLDDVDVSGAGDVQVSGIASVAPFVVDASGVGRVVLSGTGTEVGLSVSGAGAVDARDLVVRDATVDVSGTGGAWITATDSVSVDLSGLGDVHVFGDPDEVDTDVSGLGEVVFEE